jgi:hypothetical protein
MHHRSVLLVRALSSLFCLGLLAQIGLAVSFLGGSVEAFTMHGTLAWPLVVLGIVQAVVLALAFRGARAVVVLAGLLSLSLLFQMTLGQGARTAVHVSNAFLIWGFALALLIRAWRQDSIENPKPSK